MNADILDEMYDRHFVGNYKLNISNKNLPFIPDPVQLSLNKVFSYVTLLSMIIILACVGVFIRRLNVFSASESPVLNTGLAWIRNQGWIKLYHLEEGIGLYLKKRLKNRKRLTEFLFPRTLHSMISDEILDGVYCMRPEAFSEVYSDVVTKKIEFDAHIELLTRIFTLNFDKDQLPLESPLFVLVTQPLIKNDYISAQTYWEKTATLIAALSETHHVIVKPHPGEDASQYLDLDTERDVTVLRETEYPVELLVLSLLGHDDVSHISVGSTGLSTALANLSTVPVEKYSFIEYYNLDIIDESMRRCYADCSIQYVSNPKTMFGTSGQFSQDGESYPS